MRKPAIIKGSNRPAIRGTWPRPCANLVTQLVRTRPHHPHPPALNPLQSRTSRCEKNDHLRQTRQTTALQSRRRAGACGPYHKKSAPAVNPRTCSFSSAQRPIFSDRRSLLLSPRPPLLTCFTSPAFPAVSLSGVSPHRLVRPQGGSAPSDGSRLLPLPLSSRSQEKTKKKKNRRTAGSSSLPHCFVTLVAPAKHGGRCVVGCTRFLRNRCNFSLVSLSSFLWHHRLFRLCAGRGRQSS